MFILITWGRRIVGEIWWKDLLININYDSYCTMNSFSGWETRSKYTKVVPEILETHFSARVAGIERSGNEAK